MDSQRYQQARALFHAACELPATDRNGYLAAQCGSDLELFEEVRSLLEAAESAADFLSEPVKGVAEMLASPSLGLDGQSGDGLNDLRLGAGGQIGQYTIESVIARGGMGVVYRAMQASPHRYVALKVMRHGIASRQTLRRFHDEAEILARLSHPNIARIFEAGAHIDKSMREGGEAVPFFAMEYIPEALTITDHAQRADLSIQKRLELFVKVCDAIHHGHQKGVIHRDIKPANILVDSTGEPKVIDFGVARSTNSDIAVTTQHTQIGQLVGTLQYMSPEQCDGDSTNIDSRSDVYSLGAVLYELLSGVPALDSRSSTIYEAAIMVKQEEPRPLASLDKRFHGDLDAIAAKALAKNRDRRYQSAEALKNDIERHLRGDAIEARRRSTWVSVTRWMARHPIATAGASATLLAGLIFLITLFAVVYGLNQPARFVLSPEGDAAHLVTLLRRPIATLGGMDAARHSVMAELVERAEALGGDNVAIFIVPKGQHCTDHQLWVCNPESLKRPLWQTSAAVPQQMPRLPADWNSSQRVSGFIACRFEVADVFSDLPGDECIVVQEKDGDSANVVRIYSLGGEVLYEAWHLGHIAEIYWWSETGLLVCAGDRHGRPDVNRFGYAGAPWPRVVFALRPLRGHRGAAWINDIGWPPSWRSTEEFGDDLAWYKVLAPAELAGPFSPSQIRVQSLGAENTRAIAIAFESTAYGGFDFVLDEHGMYLGTNDSDEYFHSGGMLPDESPHLTDWPPPTDGQ